MFNIRVLRKLLLTITLVVLVLSLMACQKGAAATLPPAPLPTSTPERVQTLILGDVSEDPATTIKEFQPLADYLAANLGELGIKQGRVVVAPDLDTMLDYLKTGQVDLYFDSPYPALTVHERAGAVALLRRWKGGEKEYHSVIVAGKDSGVATLDDLLGQTLAFEDPGSTSGYLLPKAHLINAGYKLKEQSDSNGVAGDEIGYIFAETEENVLAWILQGKVIGGVMQNTAYEDLSAEEQNQLVVLAQTQAVPRHIVMARSDLDDALRSRLTQLMLDMHLTAEGEAVLQAFEETSQFDQFPGVPTDLFETLEQLFFPAR